MASCPKCCRANIKKRDGIRKCRRCGILPWNGIGRDVMANIKLEPDAYYPIREDWYGALERYLNNGIMPGSFMTAVLENNLKEAIGRADMTNRSNLHNIVG